MNSWRARISPDIDIKCLCCPVGDAETPIHRFFQSPRTQFTWDYTQSIMHHLLGSPLILGPHSRLDAVHYIFGSPLPRRFSPLRTIWSILCGATLWLCWIAHNQTVFTYDRWPNHLLHSSLWNALLDAGHVALMKTLRAARLHPQNSPRLWKFFDRIWLYSPILAIRVRNFVIWSQKGPPLCQFH